MASISCTKTESFCLNSNNNTFNYGRDAPSVVGVGDGGQETPEYG